MAHKLLLAGLRLKYSVPRARETNICIILLLRDSIQVPEEWVSCFSYKRTACVKTHRLTGKSAEQFANGEHWGRASSFSSSPLPFAKASISPLAATSLPLIFSLIFRFDLLKNNLSAREAWIHLLPFLLSS